METIRRKPGRPAYQDKRERTQLLLSLNKDVHWQIKKYCATIGKPIVQVFLEAMADHMKKQGEK